MDFSGRYEIPATPEIVWAALNDPDILKSCIPGCKEMTKIDDAHFEASMSVKVGPLKSTLKGSITLEEADPPHRTNILAAGQGGVAGFAKANAEIVLSLADTGTILTYTAKANLGGKLAKLGQRLIDRAAKQVADDFFARFAGAIRAASAGGAMQIGQVVLASDTSSLGTPIEGAPDVSPGRRDGLAPEIWVVGLIAVIVILLVLFGVSL